MRRKTKMPLRSKNTKRAYGGMSLHFKDLHDSEEELETELKANANEPRVTVPEDGGTSAILHQDVSLQSVHGKGNDSYIFAESSVKPDFRQLVPPSKVGPMENASTGKMMPKDTGENKNIPSGLASAHKTKSSLIVSTVEDHPLLHRSSSSESDEYGTKTSSSPHRSENQEETNERSITRGMLSSAFFDPKARTHLMSTLRKNIQHYTNSKGDLHDSDSKSRSSSVSSEYAAKTDTIKGLKERAMEPLQAVKRVLEDSMKESQSGSESTIRKRSSSENNFAGPEFKIDPRKPSGLDGLDAQVVKSVPRSSSLAVSLSNLLTETQESKDDSVVIQSSPKRKEAQKNGANKLHSQDVLSPPAKVAQNRSQALPKRSLEMRDHNFKESPPSLYLLYFLSIVVYSYFSFPLPYSLHVALLSFFIGATFSVAVLCLVVTPKKPVVNVKPPYITQSSGVHCHVPKPVFDSDQAFKGWMNEIEVYDIDTYHVSTTSSVYVTLEGSTGTLRLQTPQRNIPRRAVFGEGNLPVSNVIQQRLYDISKAKVYLVPHDLVKKRVWSKKYPICIEFSNRTDDNTKYLHGIGDSPSVDENSNVPETYDVITRDDLVEKVFLFGRTQRQKEQWFYRLQRAITIVRKNSNKAHKAAEKETSDVTADAGDQENAETKQAQDSDTLDDSSPFNPIEIYQKYYAYITSLLPDPSVYSASQQENLPKGPPSTGIDLDKSRAVHFSTLSSQSDGMPEVVLSQPKPIMGTLTQNEPGLDVAWFNIVVGRIMFDFLRLRKWADWVSNKIQKKLEKIRLPYFIDSLKLTEMDLGKTVPLVHKISLPRLDAEGIWFEMDITYNGAIQMTLETKMVLTRLGKRHSGQNKMDRKSAAMNSDEEDSAESSEDEESVLTASLPTYVQQFVPKGSENAPPGSKMKTTPIKGPSSPRQSNANTPTQEKRWVRIVDSITKSKYFQKVTETNYVKKKLQTVSNTPLVLNAELNQCHGTLCINIPPPPSDRLWYGFKDSPTMVLKACPKLGERAVTVTPITDWIEKKLIQEFKKVFLMPNMDDIPIPLMFNNLPSSST